MLDPPLKVASSNTLRYHLGRDIRDMFHLLHAAWRGTKGELHHPRVWLLSLEDWTNHGHPLSALPAPTQPLILDVKSYLESIEPPEEREGQNN